MARAIDWQKIEEEYVTGDCSYRELAEKHDVHYGTVGKHGRDGNWVEKREEFRQQTTHKTLTKTQEKYAEQRSEEAIDTMEILDDTLVHAHKAKDGQDVVPNSLDGLINAICNLVRTRQLILGEADSRVEETGDVSFELTGEIVQRSIEALAARASAGPD